MEKTGRSVDEFVAQVSPAKRRRDAETLITMMREVSGREPALWSGSIIGFGACHYAYPTGTEGDMPILAFAPRKASTTVYLDSADAHADALAALGPHTTGASCLYMKDLESVDLGVLRRVLEETQRRTAGDELPGATITVLD
ncbi:DUF1801 domain-containing protein [Microbacterium sp. 179-B 1A2 NHS]|uniref:DUF1801 domain-containing protein n=1 Tax=Microbacterium sp. 179-B 1A2 NHS TaxID=3142383 RepID=UPI0039A3ED5C